MVVVRFVVLKLSFTDLLKDLDTLEETLPSFAVSTVPVSPHYLFDEMRARMKTQKPQNCPIALKVRTTMVLVWTWMTVRLAMWKMTRKVEQVS